jgi:hypothetical protein
MKCKSNAVAVRNNEMKQTYSGNKLKYDEKTTLENNFQANKRFALCKLWPNLNTRILHCVLKSKSLWCFKLCSNSLTSRNIQNIQE